MCDCVNRSITIIIIVVIIINMQPWWYDAMQLSDRNSNVLAWLPSAYQYDDIVSVEVSARVRQPW